MFSFFSRYILNSKLSLAAKVSTVHDMKFSYDGLLVVAFDRQIMTCSVDGRQKQFMSLNDGPKRIVVVDRNTIAVSLAKSTFSVAIINIQQRHVIQYINTEYMDWQSPFACIENQLYVAVGFDIIVIDMSGNKKRRIPLGFISFDIYYDVDLKRMYCMDKVNSRLVGINKHGNTKFTFPDPNMEHARQITTDNEGNILLICHEKDDNSGYVMKIFSKRNPDINATTKLPMKRLSCDCFICFNRLTNSLVVSNADTVYIYTKKERV